MLTLHVIEGVLTDIEVHYEGFAAKDAQPKAYPDVFAQRPIEIIGKWTGKPVHFPDMLVTRQRFRTVYFGIWAAVIVAFALAFKA